MYEPDCFVLFCLILTSYPGDVIQNYLLKEVNHKIGEEQKLATFRHELIGSLAGGTKDYRQMIENAP